MNFKGICRRCFVLKFFQIFRKVINLFVCFEASVPLLFRPRKSESNQFIFFRSWKLILLSSKRKKLTRVRRRLQIQIIHLMKACVNHHRHIDCLQHQSLLFNILLYVLLVRNGRLVFNHFQFVCRQLLNRHLILHQLQLVLYTDCKY